MQVPDEMRKCVGFLGYKMANSTYKFAGTAFLLTPGKANIIISDSIYFVTARHVIDKIREKGLSDTYLRLNLKDGNAQWHHIPLKNWFTHPTDSSIDVAILKINLKAEYDHLVCPSSMCISEELIIKNNVGLGDEVFITGLFHPHSGNKRNIPIVRIGNLACLAEEQISSQIGNIDACLIEVRSIGGLSGSPVFLSLGLTRLINGSSIPISGYTFYLYGLVHGHYDTKANTVDEAEIDQADNLSIENINMGIAMVVPFRKISEVIAIFEIQEARKLNLTTTGTKIQIY